MTVYADYTRTSRNPDTGGIIIHGERRAGGLLAPDARVEIELTATQLAEHLGIAGTPVANPAADRLAFVVANGYTVTNFPNGSWIAIHPNANVRFTPDGGYTNIPTDVATMQQPECANCGSTWGASVGHPCLNCGVPVAHKADDPTWQPPGPTPITSDLTQARTAGIRRLGADGDPLTEALKPLTIDDVEQMRADAGGGPLLDQLQQIENAARPRVTADDIGSIGQAGIGGQGLKRPGQTDPHEPGCTRGPVHFGDCR